MVIGDETMQGRWKKRDKQQSAFWKFKDACQGGGETQ